MKEIQVTKYQTSDGAIWDTKKDAENRQAILDDPNSRICPTCHGTGKVWQESYDKEPGRNRTCYDCKGRGYQVLKWE